ncbi:AraC family transcriptional regulator [Flavobacterium humi]|nr:AraC family transcriptional regulator [Flavobacterium humi]
MGKFKILVFCWGLLHVNLIFSQDLKKIPDTLKKCSFLDLQNKIAKHKFNYKNNNVYANTYLLKAKGENNIEEIIYGYSSMGDVSNNFELDLKYSDSAINMAKSKMPKTLSYLYYVRGHIYYNQKMLKNALNYFLIARKHSTGMSKDLNNSIDHSIGLIKNTQGDYEEAITIYKKCEEVARVNNYSNYLYYILGLSELYNKVDKIDLAEEYINKGISLKNKDISGYYYYPYFISNRGKNYFKRKQYQKAIRHLYSQLKIIQKNNDYSNYAENCFYIGECYYQLNQDKKAISYYKKVDSIFEAKNDIYPLTIKTYERLIDYYKKNKDYKNVIFYSDQFIKADKVLYDNYKYISNKIARTYDIQEIITSKQAVISSLKNDRMTSGITIILLGSAIVVLGYILYLNKKRTEKKLQKQERLFNIYKAEREQQLLAQTSSPIIEEKSSKKASMLPIDENVVAQILSSLKQFEKERWYLRKEYTVEMLATEFKTNSHYLSKIINEIKGIRFTQYINSLRIEYLLEKLETDKKYMHYTIQALSEFCGYNSVQTFTRAFTLHTKMKPSDFLKIMRNKYLNAS